MVKERIQIAQVMMISINNHLQMNQVSLYILTTQILKNTSKYIKKISK